MRALLRTKRLNDSLEAAEDVIFTLARTIEARDRYTEGHCERVSEFSVSSQKRQGFLMLTRMHSKTAASFMILERSPLMRPY